MAASLSGFELHPGHLVLSQREEKDLGDATFKSEPIYVRDKIDETSLKWEVEEAK